MQVLQPDTLSVMMMQLHTTYRQTLGDPLQANTNRQKINELPQLCFCNDIDWQSTGRRTQQQKAGMWFWFQFVFPLLFQCLLFTLLFHFFYSVFCLPSCLISSAEKFDFADQLETTGNRQKAKKENIFAFFSYASSSTLYPCQSVSQWVVVSN